MCSPTLASQGPLDATFPDAKRLQSYTRHSQPPSLTITEQQIWLVAIGIIAVDLTFFMVPIVPFLAAYVLIARPPWFKDFIDDVYDRT